MTFSERIELEEIGAGNNKYVLAFIDGSISGLLVTIESVTVIEFGTSDEWLSRKDDVAVFKILDRILFHHLRDDGATLELLRDRLLC